MLSFQPIENFSSSNAIVKMVYSNLPITDEFPSSLLLFSVKTYASFTREEGGIGMAYNPVNDFLTTLDEWQQAQIVYAFLTIQLLIHEANIDLDDIEEVENRIGDVIDQLDQDINLFSYIETYIKNGNIPISDMSDAGSRAQDSEEMTFVESEAITITAITILMKLLSPIIGTFIDKFSKILSNDIKESHAQTIMVKFFTRKCKDLMKKLSFYINRLIEGKYKQNPSSVYNGKTLETSTRSTMDTIIVKRFVGVNLYKEDGNIIKYIAACCRSSAEPHISAANAVKIISDPVDLEKDEGNTSRMESESRQSIKTADVPILIRVAANSLWKKAAIDAGIDISIVEQAIYFYKRNPITINPISEYLLATYFGPELGGGESIKFLNSDTISKLATVLQIIAIQNGSKYIGHILTAVFSINDRYDSRQSDFVFLNSWRTTIIFSECKKIFPAGFGESEWDAKLKQIVEYLVRKDVYYCTAPSVW